MNKDNERLKTEYPFLIRRDWQGKIIKDDDWTYLDEMPEGWRKAFGEKMCQELKDILVKANYLSKYKVLQVKEKFGQLRWYGGIIPESISEEYTEWIEKYEDLSEKTCIECGKPATKISLGWISPYCDECASKIKNEEFKEIKDE